MVNSAQHPRVIQASVKINSQTRREGFGVPDRQLVVEEFFLGLELRHERFENVICAGELSVSRGNLKSICGTQVVILI